MNQSMQYKSQKKGKKVEKIYGQITIGRCCTTSKQHTKEPRYTLYNVVTATMEPGNM